MAAALLGDLAGEFIGFHRTHGDHPVLAGPGRRSPPGAEPAVVSWLGVSMYLTRPAITATLAEVGRFAPGTKLIADYMLPADLRDTAGNSYADLVMPVAAERGEPWLTFLTPGGKSALLAEHGFGTAEQARRRDQVPPGVWNRTDALRPMDLSVITRAIVRPARRVTPT